VVEPILHGGNLSPNLQARFCKAVFFGCFLLVFVFLVSGFVVFCLVQPPPLLFSKQQGGARFRQSQARGLLPCFCLMKKARFCTECLGAYIRRSVVLDGVIDAVA